MGRQLLHTPEGVRDIYGLEYAKKLAVEEKLHQKLAEYGYQDIQTPTFEFFDVFSKEIGTTPSKELYKFFDKEGNTLVLRPDFTPSMARCAAKYFMEEEIPIRFSYVGNTFTNNSNLQGKLKEVTQMGTELIGDDSIEADAETISLVIESLLNTGLRDFQLSVGDIGYFKGICEEISLDAELEVDLREYISNKNLFGAEELMISHKIPVEKSRLLLKSADLFGGIEILKEADSLVNNKQSKLALQRLEALYQVLCAYGIEKYVSFDLGMLSNYNYYTGVIFKVYTYGIGEVVVKGGRYDNLLGCFGKQAPAIGFVIVIDDLMQALQRQNVQIPLVNKNIMIVYEKPHYLFALAKAKELRSQNVSVEMVLKSDSKQREDYIAFAKNNLKSDLIFWNHCGIIEQLTI